VSSTARMNRLVQDLLNYSRLSRIDVESLPVSVESAVADACGQIDPELRSGISVSMPRKLSVRGHAPVVRQAIANLINNAVKFTKPGARPKVDVTAFQRDNLVHIQVKDEGI